MGGLKRKFSPLARLPELLIEDFDQWEDEARYIEPARRGYISTEDIESGDNDES